MINNSAKIMFLNILMMGTLISTSANSWLGAWMGLEINLLAFIPLMSDNKLMSTEASLKYFLTQALASSMFLFAVIMLMMNFSKETNYFTEIIFSSLLLKSGSAPFHFWFPNVMEGLSWTNALIMMTWQKIAPLMLISYIIMKPLILMSIMLSSLIGALGGLNQTSLRKLMAYSSINHLSWMLAAMEMMYNNSNLWLMYFLFYTFLTFSMVFMFNMFKISYINQLFTLFFKEKSIKFFFFFNLLSLGGLPPFLGFMPKMMVIQSLTMNNQLFLMTFMLMMTLITLYFYLRLCYSAFMLNYFDNNWLMSSIYKLSTMKTMLIYSFISSFGLFMTFSLYFLF